jgi:heme/copper-type cytochrome/quinol oxidase subunit 3
MPSRSAEAPFLDNVEERLDDLLAGLDRLPPGPPPGGGGDGSPFRGPGRRLLLDSARIGMLLFLAAEAMFFAGLISAFLVFRLGSPSWRLPWEPRLPIAVTLLNTALLFLSGYTMYLALHALRQGRPEPLRRHLFVTALLGATFLTIQGSEWVRLIGYGLTLAGSLYGSTFYLLIGTHGLHVFAGAAWLLIALAWVRKSDSVSPIGVELCGMYWFFVVGLWAVLFPLVYLS